jgi:hypothetical protein
MTGYVHTINRRRGLAAIATRRSGFTIIELVGNPRIDVADEMEWDDTALGSAEYHNLTKGVRTNVVVLNHGVAQADVRKQLRL